MKAPPHSKNAALQRSAGRTGRATATKNHIVITAFLAQRSRNKTKVTRGPFPWSRQLWVLRWILQPTEMWRYKRSILNIYAVNELLLEREREHRIKY